MTQPAAQPTTLAAVKAQLQLSTAAHDAQLDTIVAAVSAFVRGLPVAQLDVDDPPTAQWPASIQLGATMLAARLFKRRDTPSGVAVFGDTGAVYVQRNDPDVALLLQLGAYAKPAVG